jgi:hypothetical protein
MTVLFGTNTLLPQTGFAQVAFLPAAGSMVNMTARFNPIAIKGVQLHPDNPFKFDFIVDTGDSESSQQELQEEGKKMIGYFLASLTTPEKDMWVNLSPYEKQRIIPSTFGQTEMGKELLSQDYLLKQIMATALYPERQLGKEFWKKVYAQAQTKFGTTNVPVNTFNKVWILPDQALVYENSKTNSVFVVRSSLKVMLEQDYLAAKKHHSLRDSSAQNDVSALSSQVIREIVIPALTKEVNEGRNFAPLRQVYQSLILAAWYKKNLHDNVIAQAYVDRGKIAGIDVKDKKITEKIYHQYLKAYRKGVYNFIKDEIDPVTQTEVPRKYFSGGLVFNMSQVVAATKNRAMVATAVKGKHWADMTTSVEPASIVSIADTNLEKIERSLLIRWNKIEAVKEAVRDLSADRNEVQGLRVRQLDGRLVRLESTTTDILATINSIRREKDEQIKLADIRRVEAQIKALDQSLDMILRSLVVIIKMWTQPLPDSIRHLNSKIEDIQQGKGIVGLPGVTKSNPVRAIPRELFLSLGEKPHELTRTNEQDIVRNEKIGKRMALAAAVSVFVAVTGIVVAWYMNSLPTTRISQKNEPVAVAKQDQDRVPPTLTLPTRVGAAVAPAVGGMRGDIADLPFVRGDFQVSPENGKIAEAASKKRPGQVPVVGEPTPLHEGALAYVGNPTGNPYLRLPAARAIQRNFKPQGARIVNPFLEPSIVNSKAHAHRKMRPNQAMIATPATPAKNGGIDVTQVNVATQGGGVRTAFSDPAQLQMLLHADGLVPVIYKIQLLSAPMVNALLGL